MNKYLQIVVVSLIALIAGNVTTACSSGSSPQPLYSASTATKVSAPELFASYSKDKKAANKLYKGKLLEVAGVIYQVGTDPLVDDAPEVTLSGGTFGQARGVDCTFDKRYASQVAKLQKGQTVKALGICSGWAVNVWLRDCQLVQ